MTCYCMRCYSNEMIVLPPSSPSLSTTTAAQKRTNTRLQHPSSSKFQNSPQIASELLYELFTINQNRIQFVCMYIYIYIYTYIVLRIFSNTQILFSAFHRILSSSGQATASSGFKQPNLSASQRKISWSMGLEDTYLPRGLKSKF